METEILKWVGIITAIVAAVEAVDHFIERSVLLANNIRELFKHGLSTVSKTAGTE